VRELEREVEEEERTEDDPEDRHQMWGARPEPELIPVAGEILHWMVVTSSRWVKSGVRR
jgi:hypothetical protein